MASICKMRTAFLILNIVQLCPVCISIVTIPYNIYRAVTSSIHRALREFPIYRAVTRDIPGSYSRYTGQPISKKKCPVYRECAVFECKNFGTKKFLDSRLRGVVFLKKLVFDADLVLLDVRMCSVMYVCVV